MSDYIVADLSEKSIDVWCGKEITPTILVIHNSRTFDPEWFIIPTQQCYRNNGGDGHWNLEQKKWDTRPCAAKDCWRHFRLYCWRKIKKLRQTLPQRSNWHHIRLSTCIELKRGKRFDQLNRWQAKIRSAYPDCHMIAVKHRNKNGVHIHVLLGTNAILDGKLVRKAWQSHFPAKKTKPFKPQHVMCKKHDNPMQWIRYVFLGTKKKPRTIPPWYGIAGHAICTVSKPTVAFIIKLE